MSDDIGRLTVASVISVNISEYSDCEHDNGCGRKKNTAIILICHSFIASIICPSNSWPLVV